MPLVHECAYEDCHILTMSLYCLEHEGVTDRSVDDALLEAAAAAAAAAGETDET